MRIRIEAVKMDPAIVQELFTLHDEMRRPTDADGEPVVILFGLRKVGNRFAARRSNVG